MAYVERKDFGFTDAFVADALHSGFDIITLSERACKKIGRLAGGMQNDFPIAIQIGITQCDAESCIFQVTVSRRV